ncbi:hypothetical protein GCM10010282_37770 [Streptomyces roseolus]|nr:hypothetical protein GCM10010282_37770 [Streptomyces roseolus]
MRMAPRRRDGSGGRGVGQATRVARLSGPGAASVAGPGGRLQERLEVGEGTVRARVGGVMRPAAMTYKACGARPVVRTRTPAVSPGPQTR